MLLPLRALVTTAVLTSANSDNICRVSAFIPTRGLLSSSYPFSRNRSPLPTMPIGSTHSRLKRRQSILQVDVLNEKSDIEQLPSDGSTIISTDDESLYDLEHDKPKRANGDTSNSTPMLWGVPLQSILLLNIAAIIWGTQHAVIKSVVDNISIGPDAAIKEWMSELFGTQNVGSHAVLNDGEAAAYFTLARFGLAALLASPYTPGLNGILKRIKGFVYSGGDDAADIQMQNTEVDGHLTTSENKVATTQVDETILSWRYGLELGVYMFLGYAFQAIGLETTTASRSGFLLYLNVKLVPFFSFLLFGKQIQTSTWISALVAFCGTALLTLDNSGDEISFGLNTGDLWSIAAAAASAMFILRTETASKAVSKSSELNAASLWTVSFLSVIWTMVITSRYIEGGELIANMQMIQTTIQRTVDSTLSTFIDHPLQMFYLSAVTTTLANYIQSKGQKDISAERASIIYAMDPVYGSLVAGILLGEKLGTIGWIGSGLIFLAAATNALFDFGRAEDRKKR